jgi:hypothetical protein
LHILKSISRSQILKTLAELISYRKKNKFEWEKISVLWKDAADLYSRKVLSFSLCFKAHNIRKFKVNSSINQSDLSVRLDFSKIIGTCDKILKKKISAILKLKVNLQCYIF